jgi:hypothetical protein
MVKTIQEIGDIVTEYILIRKQNEKSMLTKFLQKD